MDLKKYRDIPYQKRCGCMICGKKSVSPIIRLPKFPLTELYVRSKPRELLGFADQALHLCSNCGHGQIANVIDVKLQYGNTETYNFRTSQSITGRETTIFFIDFLNQVLGQKKFNTIVEVGCNDLYLLKGLKSRARQLIGIDPILKGREQEMAEDNISVIGDFFENILLPERVDVILCKDVIEHVADPRMFIKRIVDRASEDTMLFVQVPLLETILEDGRFDQIFHQHLNYFSIQSFLYMLDGLGCGLVDYAINYDHWGTGLFAFKKGKNPAKWKALIQPVTPACIRGCYDLFKIEMHQVNNRMLASKGGKIYGYGGALMLAVLSYHLGNDLSCLSGVMDDDKKKAGMSYLNVPVSIVHTSQVKDLRGATVLLTAVASKINVRRMLANLISLKPRHILYPLRTI